MMDYIRKLYPEIVDIRRRIHQNPELSFHEKNTSEFIFNYLKDLELSPVRIEGTYSVVCDIIVGNYPTILLRADIDALPIEEETGLPFSSKNKDVMHACGHDIHTSILLGVANVIAHFKKDLKQNIVLLFQSGEEKNPGGAKAFTESDFFKNKKIDTAYALHLSPEIPTGKIGIKRGPIMASSDEIYIDIIGKGGHAAIPDTINPIKTASEVFLEVNNLNSLKLNEKFIVAIGYFNAEGATNVIPSDAQMKGTIRTFNSEDRKSLHNKIEEIINKISKTNGGEAKLNIDRGYPTLINDDAVCDKLFSIASKIISKDNILNIPARLTADDFSYIAEKVPSCYFRLGCNSDTQLHTSTFNPDEECILVGIEIFCGLAL